MHSPDLFRPFQFPFWMSWLDHRILGEEGVFEAVVDGSNFQQAISNPRDSLAHQLIIAGHRYRIFVDPGLVFVQSVDPLPGLLVLSEKEGCLLRLSQAFAWGHLRFPVVSWHFSVPLLKLQRSVAVSSDQRHSLFIYTL